MNLPAYAIRAIPGYHRKSYSKWHFQNPSKMNKTVCGITIADGRGWKMRTKAGMALQKKRQRWESRDVFEIRCNQFCKTCLGPIKC